MNTSPLDEPFKSWASRHVMWLQQLSSGKRVNLLRMLDFYNHITLMVERKFSTFEEDQLNADDPHFVDFVRSEHFETIYHFSKSVFKEHPNFLEEWYRALCHWLDSNETLLENNQWVRDTIGFQFLLNHERYTHYREDSQALLREHPWMVGFFLEQLHHAHIKDLSAQAIDLTYGDPRKWPNIDDHGGLDAYIVCARLYRAPESHVDLQTQLTVLAPSMTGHVNAMLGIDPWDSNEPIEAWARRAHASYTPVASMESSVESNTFFNL